MKNIHIKHKGGSWLECWIEVFDQATFDWMVVAECKVIDVGDIFLIDEIFVKSNFRRKGYATKIVQKLQSIKKVAPVGIMNNEASVKFWAKLGMEDWLNDERCDEYQWLVDSSNEFDIKVKEA